MRLNIDRELTHLQGLTVGQLQQRYAELFGQPSRSRHKQHLVRRIAWRLQALVEGDLSERARRRAAELACDADVRLQAPRRRTRTVPASAADPITPKRDPRLPMAGTILVRHYRGQTLQVRVLDEGFEYEGRIERTLTAVAKRITGKHWNGFHFFGLS